MLNCIGTVNEIVDVLFHNTKLQKVHIGSNKLETSDAIKITRVLDNISSLSEFDMSKKHYW